MEITLSGTENMRTVSQSSTVIPRLFGLAAMLFGVIAWWYNWHLAATTGGFLIKACVFVPLAESGGLLLLLRPEWAGPWRKDATRGQKTAVMAVLVFTTVGSGIEFLRLERYVSRRAPRQKIIAWTPAMGTPAIPASLAARENPPSVTFLDREYRLGSFNQRPNPMWEFVAGNETVENWTTLLTVIDRPDAHTRAELDRLAEGILSNYRSRGQILAAKTMGQTPESVYNYIVAAFEEPSQQRYELNFVKVSLGTAHAVVVVYGVRVAGQEYRAKASRFLTGNSGDIGRALERLVLPDLAGLPRRPF